jgi:hypothetical protein
VWIEWGGTWYPGYVIVPNADGTVFVRYDGYGTQYDESVPATRLRVP